MTLLQPTPSADLAAARASFLTLPVECLALIAEHVHHQDSDEIGDESDCPYEWEGRSLYAFALTCRLLNELANKHLFHTVSGVQLESPFFLSDILPLHGPHIRHLTLTHDSPRSSPSHFSVALSLLPSIPSLTSLSLGSTTAIELFGDPGVVLSSSLPLPPSPSTSSSLHSRVTSYQSFATRLTSLSLSELLADEALAIIRLSPNLHHLKLHSDDLYDPDSWNEEFVSYIGNMDGLHSLELSTVDEDEPFQLDERWSLQKWPSLRHLALHDFTPLPHNLEFLATVAPTLLSLSLNFPLPHSSSPTPRHFDPIPFPHLLSLSFNQVLYPTFNALMSSFLPPPPRTAVDDFGPPTRTTALRELTVGFPTTAEPKFMDEVAHLLQQVVIARRTVEFVEWYDYLGIPIIIRTAVPPS